MAERNAGGNGYTDDLERDDPVFGTLRWDSRWRNWETIQDLAPGLPVTVSIDFGNDDRSQADFDPTRRLPDAYETWSDILKNYAAIHTAATVETVSRYTELREQAPDAPAHTDQEIAAMVVPYRVSIFMGQPIGATVHFEEGDLLGGHSMDVELSAAGEPLDVAMNG